MKHRTFMYPLLVSTALAASAPGCGNPSTSTNSSPSGPEVPNVGQVSNAPNPKCSNSSELPPTVVGTESLARQAFTVTVPLRKGKQALSVALTSAQSMSLGNGSSVKGYGVAFAPVLNAGDGRIDLKEGSTVGDVLSHGEAELRSGSHVVGTLVAAQLNKHTKATIDGHVQLSPDVTADEPLAWSGAFPAAAVDNIDINRCALGILAPKRYGRVRVDAGGRLRLKPGTYYFEELHLKHQSTLELAADPGAPASPVVIYVRKRFAHRGEIPFVNGKRTDLTIVYLGDEDLLVDSPANGAIIAPSAWVKFQRTQFPHHTHVFARQIDVLDRAQIVHEPARGLLNASKLKVSDCVNQVPIIAGAGGREAEVQYQYDILQHCTARSSAPIVNRVRARANVDYFENAGLMVQCAISAGQYLGFSRSRKAQVLRAESDLSYAAKLISQPDADGDWVDDAQDKCPGTPPMIPVGSDGCAAPLPPAPDTQAVCDIISRMPMIYDPNCLNQTPPGVVPAVGIWAKTPNDIYFYASEAPRTSPKCANYYEWEFWMTDLPTGKVVKHMNVIFADSEVNHTGALAPLPAPFVQFDFHGSDPGIRGDVVRLRSQGFRAVYRVRVINSGGVPGPWTQRRLSEKMDCRSVNVNCGG